MALSSHQTKLPLARLPAATIAYVTDSPRDAEALAQIVDAPIIIRRRRSQELGDTLPHSFRAIEFSS